MYYHHIYCIRPNWHILTCVARLDTTKRSATSLITFRISATCSPLTMHYWRKPLRIITFLKASIKAFRSMSNTAANDLTRHSFHSWTVQIWSLFQGNISIVVSLQAIFEIALSLKEKALWAGECLWAMKNPARPFMSLMLLRAIPTFSDSHGEFIIRTG